MYKKDLITTVTLAMIIATAGCGKEEVVSALDNATEVVASVEDKVATETTETVKDTGDASKASIPTTSVKEETPKQEESVTENVVVPADNVEAMTKEEVFDYLDNTPAQQWDMDVVCKALILDGNWNIPDEFWDNYDRFTPEEDAKLGEALDQQYANIINNYHDPEGEALYEQLIAEQNSGGNDHPTGPTNPGYTMGDPVEYTIDRGLTGNVS